MNVYEDEMELWPLSCSYRKIDTMIFLVMLIKEMSFDLWERRIKTHLN